MPGNTSTGSGRLPDWVEPQLATLTKERFSDPAWIYERKLDGERCLAFVEGGQVRLMTRNQKSANASYPDGRLAYAGKVGTGFDDRTLSDLHDELVRAERKDPPFQRGKLPKSGVHWVEPRLVAQVGFSEWTTDGMLRHPRFQGLRRDKQPADVVRETA